MRFLSLATVGLASLLHLADSQSLAGLPQCAESCALNAIGSTGCSATDDACICKASSFLSSVDSCIQTACSPSDQEATLQFAVSFCSSAGVTITIPSAAAPATASAAASASASAVTSATATVSASAVSPTATVAASAPAATSSYAATSATGSAPPAATFTGAAPALKQQWAGIAGVIGLGFAAVL